MSLQMRLAGAAFYRHLGARALLDRRTYRLDGDKLKISKIGGTYQYVKSKFINTCCTNT
ncbi:hypothetical protein SAMN02745136_01355 [Anaerocolumna jejuensis DSM 15929]|uniref:Uncharacterized protein n=1 Tax=Anaerocolumna jejuensis DSM 15929 TaxID=1121322 RepID=A0A1M6NLX9_9FIRM|nr:hypothetical protein [Anaerocolumna jejuensis]SHJ96614.1 hypothetical protein SAMN02745136_01355 [Anaerocolumna jejuensis DSM 15929]